MVGVTACKISEIVQALFRSRMVTALSDGIEMDKKEMSTSVFCIMVVSVVFLVVTSFAYAEVVGIWLFDEEDGKIVTDASGNGHDGEIIGNAKRRPSGRFRKAIEFFHDADAEPGALWPGYVTVRHHEDQDLLEFSLTAWVKLSDIAGAELNEHRVSIRGLIAGKTGHIQQSNYALWVSGAGAAGALAGEAGHVTFGFTVSKPKWAQVFVEKTGRRAEVTDSKWHHVAGTYKEPMLSVYVDGNLVGEQENEAVNNALLPGGKEIPKPTFARSRGKPGPFMIGAQHIGRQVGTQRPSYGVDGLIDEVGLFNHALTPEEIKLISRQGLAQFLAVDPRQKLATTWGEIKRN